LDRLRNNEHPQSRRFFDPYGDRERVEQTVDLMVEKGTACTTLESRPAFIQQADRARNLSVM